MASWSIVTQSVWCVCDEEMSGAQEHGDYAARRATARHRDGRVREGMQAGRWAGGRWEAAAAEAQWPVCRGCARCRAWRWLECAQCGSVGGQAMAAWTQTTR